MILIIGGAYHNKLSYALKTYNILKEDMQDGKTCPLDEAFSKKGIYNLHLYIKRSLEQGFINKENALSLVDNIGNKEIIICDEIGSGIIPLDKFERSYRDITGQIVSYISEKADQVIRIYYGIPSVLKE